MGVVVVEPRTGDLIPLPLAKAHLRVEHDDHDVLIRSYIEASASWLDGPKGWLGLCLGRQTLLFDHPGFGDRDGLELPCGPLVSVEGIGYRGWGSGVVTVAPETYEADVRTNRVRPVVTGGWPPVGRSPVSVTYVAGYAPDKLPGAIQSAILLNLTILYDQPEDKVLTALERARDDLLSPHRVRRF